MVETMQIEPQRERTFWREFVRFHTGSTIHSGIPFPPAVAPVKSQTVDSGWTTDTSKFEFPDEDENDDEKPDEDAPKEGKKRLYLKAIFALLNNNTNAAAAREVGISCRQLMRWKKNDEFKTLYEQTKKELYAVAVSGMKSVLVAAGIAGAKTLQRIAEDKQAADTAQVQAAKALTQLALQIEDIESIQARLRELELERAVDADSGTFSKTQKD